MTMRSSARTKPRGDHPQVGTWPGCGREGLEPTWAIHPATERGTGDAWVGHLQLDIVTDPPPLTDQGAVHVDAVGREVLAELAGRQRHAELVRPPLEVLDRVGVDGLVVAAVAAAVADVVTDQAAALSVGLAPG